MFERQTNGLNLLWFAMRDVGYGSILNLAVFPVGLAQKSGVVDLAGLGSGSSLDDIHSNYNISDPLRPVKGHAEYISTYI